MVADEFEGCLFVDGGEVGMGDALDGLYKDGYGFKK